MYLRDGKDGVNEKVALDNKQVIEVLHVQASMQERVSLTNILCRDCYTRDKGRSQLAMTQHDGKSEVKKNVKTILEQMAMETFQKLRGEGVTVERTGTGRLVGDSLFWAGQEPSI